MAYTLSGLMKWTQREEWREVLDAVMARHLEPACLKAEIRIEDLPGIIGDERLGVLWACIFEDFLTYDFEEHGNIVDEYLKRRGWKESVPNKRYMAALRMSAMSLYEVSDIVRDRGFLARDLVRGGEPIRVNEKSATHSLKQWDRIAARIVHVEARIEMAGGVLPFDYDSSEAVLKSIRRSQKKSHARGNGNPAHDLAFVFVDTWLGDILERILHPTIPQLCNADGDDIVWTTVSYPLTPPADTKTIGLALARIPSLRPENEKFWNWTDAPKRGGKRRSPKGQTFVTMLDDGSTVLGTVELKDRTLVLEANSRERAKRGQTLIEPVLTGLIGSPVVESKTMAEMVASRPAGRAENLSSGLPPDEERDILRAFLAEYYRNLLDEPVPMLGNISPRCAAKTSQGRVKLVEWLKFLENGAAKNMSAGGNYDLRWMWNELGIAALRR